MTKVKQEMLPYFKEVYEKYDKIVSKIKSYIYDVNTIDACNTKEAFKIETKMVEELKELGAEVNIKRNEFIKRFFNLSYIDTYEIKFDSNKIIDISFVYPKRGKKLIIVRG